MQTNLIENAPYRYRGCGYLTDLMYPPERKRRLDALEAAIRAVGVPDALAYAGVSGSLVGPAMADRLGCLLLPVRKAKETTGARPRSRHSDWTVEGFAHIQTYAVIDDLVSSGDTVRYIRRRIREWAKQCNIDVPVFQGVFLALNDQCCCNNTERSYFLPPTFTDTVWNKEKECSEQRELFKI